MQEQKDLNDHIVVGVYGEDIVCKDLMNRGFDIFAKNIRYKWGELDIVAKNKGRIHFIEVKTRYVIHETFDKHVNPAENMTTNKIKKFFRSVETFLGDIGGQDVCDWQIDFAIVKIMTNNKYKIEWYEDIVL